MEHLKKNKFGFSLVELIIIVAVLGILAAMVLPQFQENSTQAKEAVAKDSLRILRSVIELYAAQHSGVPPGYENNKATGIPTKAYFLNQTVESGRYLKKMPKNPFNNLDTMRVLSNSESLPPAMGTYGWIYKPATMTIKLDWRGADKTGIAYFDY
jgi:general secretion pathway protein G